MQHRAPTSPGRGPRSAPRAYLHLRGWPRRRRARPRGTRPRHAAPRPRPGAGGCPRGAPRRVSKPVSIAKSSSTSGSSLRLTSLTVTSKEASAAGELLGSGSRPGKVSSTVRVSPALRARPAPARSPGQVARRRAPRAGRGPRHPAEWLRRSRPPRPASRHSRSPRSRPLRRGAPPSRAREALAQTVDLAAGPARPRRAGSRRPTSRPLYSPSSAVGSTPISNENSSASPCGGSSPRSSWGRRRARCRRRSIASDVPVAERVAHRLLQHGLAADPLDHQRRRDLAAAKAGSFSSRPSWRALRSMRCSSSLGGTCT